MRTRRRSSSTPGTRPIAPRSTRPNPSAGSWTRRTAATGRERTSRRPRPRFAAGTWPREAGLGPVRFSPMKTSGGQHTRASLDRTFETVPTNNPSTNSSPAKPAEPHPPRPTPLSHEAETSGSARRLGEPPTQHNPRAEVPFAKAKSPITKTQKLDAASRTKKATDRARSLGFRPTRAPEAFTNPNGTGKPTTTDRGAPPSSGPTVPFEEEVERFRVARLRRKMEHSFEEDKYDDDEAFDDEEAFEAPVASIPRAGSTCGTRTTRTIPDVDPFGSGVRARDAEDPHSKPSATRGSSSRDATVARGGHTDGE